MDRQTLLFIGLLLGLLVVVANMDSSKAHKVKAASRPASYTSERPVVPGCKDGFCPRTSYSLPDLPVLSPQVQPNTVLVDRRETLTGQDMSWQDEYSRREQRSDQPPDKPRLFRRSLMW